MIWYLLYGTFMELFENNVLWYLNGRCVYRPFYKPFLGLLESEFDKAYVWEKYIIFSHISNATKITKILVVSHEIYPKYDTCCR